MWMWFGFVFLTERSQEPLVPSRNFNGEANLRFIPAEFFRAMP
jgi:hypothetical protein